MKDSNLIASVALFGELYNSDKYQNVSDIIAEFIKGAVRTETLWSTNSTELTLALQRIYEFYIPEAVIKATIKKKLQKVYTYTAGRYFFDKDLLEKDSNSFNVEMQEITDTQNQILEGLFEYVETNTSNLLDEFSKKEVTDNFIKWLLDNGYSEKYSNVISAYIVANKKNHSFIKNLNQVREGLILYQGIRYTSDVNDLGNWNTELKIFLNTEILFNAAGYNGELYKEIFFDFHKLVTKINQKSRNTNGEKLIELRFFPETESEIDYFFQVAESIKRGTRSLDPSKTAMRSIIQDCPTPTDIQLKRTKFYQEIKQLGIIRQDSNISAYSFHDYIVENELVVESLEKESKEKGKSFNKDEYDHFCKMFTKINYYRGGVNDVKFERIGHIFLAGNRFALWLSNHPKVKFKESDIAFALDIEYVTCRFWFKLCKGFGDSAALPKSLEVVTKAQVILSSQVNSFVGKKYDEFQQAFDRGELKKEDFLELSYSLREKAMRPEDIDEVSLDDSLGIIYEEDYMEQFYRDKVLREQQVNELRNEKTILSQEVDVLRERERKREIEETENKRLADRAIYLEQKQLQYKKSSRGDIWYFIRAGLALYIAGLLLAISKHPEIAKAVEAYALWGTFIIVLLALLGAWELFGRTFIRDKERVKRGRTALLVLFRNEEKARKMNLLQQEWISEYDTANPSQI